MELYLVRTDPVQQIAAEPDTLRQLLAALRPETQPAQAAPELIDACRNGFTGWPLVRDSSLPPGVVHCRPTPPPLPKGPEVATSQQNSDGTWSPATPEPLADSLDFEVSGTGPFEWEAWRGMSLVAHGTARTRLGLHLALFRAKRKHSGGPDA
ncbi:hypothetical protein [Streptomyces sp. NPDC096153]|uniref:hypothetical protein n=1 Tax=Streptomyces sp. NPDC096153 TaxID=3155548 RepID=UPI00332E867B